MMDREKFQWTKTMKSPPLNRATQTYRKRETKAPRGKQKGRGRAREREKIHPLSHIHMHGFASTLTAPRFRTSFFHPDSAFLHPCTPVFIHTVACLFLSSWVLCLRVESSVCLLVGRGRRKKRMAVALRVSTFSSVCTRRLVKSFVSFIRSLLPLALASCRDFSLGLRLPEAGDEALIVKV